MQSFLLTQSVQYRVICEINDIITHVQHYVYHSLQRMWDSFASWSDRNNELSMTNVFTMLLSKVNDAA